MLKQRMIGSIALACLTFGLAPAIATAADAGCQSVQAEVGRLKGQADTAAAEANRLESEAFGYQIRASSINIPLVPYDSRDPNYQNAVAARFRAQADQQRLNDQASALKFQAVNARSAAANLTNQANALQQQCAVITVEAEDSVLVANAKDDGNALYVEQRFAGFSGRGYVAGWKSNYQWVDFKILAPTAGTYNVGLRYAAEGDASRVFVVNEVVQVVDLQFKGTGSYTNYANVTVQNVVLTAGENHIRLIYHSPYGSKNWMNLDRLDASLS
jgi:Carbohydrate binding module (family 35)